MWLLHPGDDLLGQGLPRRPPAADRGPGSRGAGRQPVPVHRLPEDRRRGAGRGEPDGLRRGGVVSTGTRVAGQSLPRIDAPGKVTGSAVYAADFALPGMLYGMVFRSAEPHARLVRIDTARASAMPGVRAVITAADAADVRYGAAVKDEPVFAPDVVRYVGQPLAAVAAVPREAAEAGLAALEAGC